MGENWANDKIQALLQGKSVLPKPMTAAKKKKILDAYQKAFFENGWGFAMDKLISALNKHFEHNFAIFINGRWTMFSTFNTHKLRKNVLFKHDVIIALAEDAQSFDVYLAVVYHLEVVPLHKPIKVPVSTPLKQMAKDLVKAYDALVYGVVKVVGVENLPGYPGAEKLEIMVDTLATQAGETLQRLAKVVAAGKLR